MTDRNELNKKTDDELRDIARDLDVFVHHNLKRENIINTIMDAIVPAGEVPPVETKVITEDELRTPAPMTKEQVKEVVARTGMTDKQAEILKLTESHRARGMVVLFPDADSWHFRMGVKEDTGNVNISLQNIRRCADLVCKPAKAPTAQKP